MTARPIGAALRSIRASFAPASGHVDLSPLVISSADGSLERSDSTHAALVIDGGETRHRVIMDGAGTGVPPAGRTRREVVVDGWRFELDTEAEARATLRDRASRGAAALGADGPTEVRAVIPGRVLAVAVAIGEAVEAGLPLVVIEAMKMQNDVRSPRDGVVARLDATAGKTVEVGDLLVVLE